MVKQVLPQFWKQKKRVLFIILISLVLGTAMTFFIQYIDSLSIQSFNATPQFTISDETVFLPPIQILTSGPSYFTSAGKIYAYFSSPYALGWETFNVWMSLDNSSWIAVPLLTSISYNRSQMANLGIIGLDDPNILIYVKYYIPPQTVYTESNVTTEEIGSSFNGYVSIVKEATSKDRTQWIITFCMAFGIVLTILNLLFLKKESNPRTKVKKQKNENTAHHTHAKTKILILIYNS